MDVTRLMMDFQEMNQVCVTVAFGSAWRGKELVLRVEAVAWSTDRLPQEAKRLGSASVICSDMNLKTWNALLIHLLYMLDGQLALNEMRGEG